MPTVNPATAQQQPGTRRAAGNVVCLSYIRKSREEARRVVIRLAKLRNGRHTQSNQQDSRTSDGFQPG